MQSKDFLEKRHRKYFLKIPTIKLSNLFLGLTTSSGKKVTAKKFSLIPNSKINPYPLNFPLELTKVRFRITEHLHTEYDGNDQVFRLLQKTTSMLHSP
jgi:hypothetical protein